MNFQIITIIIRTSNNNNDNNYKEKYHGSPLSAERAIKSYATMYRYIRLTFFFALSWMYEFINVWNLWTIRIEIELCTNIWFNSEFGIFITDMDIYIYNLVAFCCCLSILAVFLLYLCNNKMNEKLLSWILWIKFTILIVIRPFLDWVAFISILFFSFYSFYCCKI